MRRSTTPGLLVLHAGHGVSVAQSCDRCGGLDGPLLIECQTPGSAASGARTYRDTSETVTYFWDMNTTENPGDFGFGSGDALASVETGADGQLVMISGWGHSNFDTGTPGPHVDLRGSEGPGMVFSSSQIANLVDALILVRDRIDGQFGHPVAASE